MENVNHFIKDLKAAHTRIGEIWDYLGFDVIPNLVFFVNALIPVYTEQVTQGLYHPTEDEMVDDMDKLLLGEEMIRLAEYWYDIGDLDKTLYFYNEAMEYQVSVLGNDNWLTEAVKEKITKIAFEEIEPLKPLEPFIDDQGERRLEFRRFSVPEPDGTISWLR